MGGCGNAGLLFWVVVVGGFVGGGWWFMVVLAGFPGFWLVGWSRLVLLFLGFCFDVFGVVVLWFSCCLGWAVWAVLLGVLLWCGVGIIYFAGGMLGLGCWF